MSQLPKWGGAAAARWTAAVLATYGTTCHLNLPGCTIVATTGDHIEPREDRPDLQFVVSNGRPACLHCNQKRGRKPLARPKKVDATRFFESRPGSLADSAGPPPRATGKNRER